MIERVELSPGYAISRVIRGNWQLAGGHGTVGASAALDALGAAFDAGLTTFDCADIYTGVEALIGAFRARLAARRGADAARALKVHTKLVPDLDRLPTISKADIEGIVDESLRRLGGERLDLVQFHWWDYAVPGAVQALAWLDEIRAAGKIHLLGATNFDRAHTAAILDAGVPLASMQTQYSLLDPRPENGLAALCAARGVGLLPYGTVAGGFLGDRWLGRPEPTGPLENRSLTKYKLIIDDFGGWALFQELLCAARGVADRARGRRRHGGEPLGARPARGGCRHRGRAQRGPRARQCRHRRPAAHRAGSRRPRRRAVAPAGSRGRRLRAGARPHRSPRRRDEVQPQRRPALKARDRQPFRLEAKNEPPTLSAGIRGRNRSLHRV